MPTIEFYGAGNLNLTSKFANAIYNYAVKKSFLPKKWKFIDTTLNPDKHADLGKPITLSTPIYYLETENEDFYSFDKIMAPVHCMKQELDRICKLAKDKERVLQRIAKLKVSDDYSIKLLNIQSGNEYYWSEEIHSINKNTFYIFFWSMAPKDRDLYESNPVSLKKIKREYEIKDKIWGYSKFMRDFLKTRDLCYEWEISEIKYSSDDLLKGLIEKKIDKVNRDNSNQDINRQIKLLNVKVKNILNQHEATKGTNTDFTDLAKLHLYNRNNHFDYEYFDTKFNLSSTAAYSAHMLLRDKDKLLLATNKEKVESLGGLESKLFFYDLFKNITDACISYSNPTSNEAPDFIFLDDVNLSSLDVDKDKVYLDKYKRLHEWFLYSCFYYSTDRNFLVKFFCPEIKDVIYKFDFQKKLSFTRAEISSLKAPAFNDKPLFIGIDIDWNGEDYGLELLKEFRKNVRKIMRPCFIFVFSRYEYPSTIRKAIASGALFYVTKQNYMNMVPRIHSIMRMLKENPGEIIDPKYLNYENWHLLSKLEPAKVVQLKTQLINGFKSSEIQKTVYKKEHEWTWIKKLPKADLHCHIGSCIGPEFLPVTALMVLSELNPPVLFTQEETQLSTKDKIACIIKFVSLFVQGLVFEGGKVVLKSDELHKTFGVTDQSVCLFEWITKALDLERKKVFPETALLDPGYSDMNLAFYATGQEHDYFKLRQQLKEMNVNYDTIMLFFILMIFVKEKQINNGNGLKTEITKILGSLFGVKTKKGINTLCKDNLPIDKDEQLQTNKFIDNLFTIIKEIIKKNRTSLNVFLGFNNNCKDILKNLQTAKEGSSGSLFNYLRGCEYGGAPHLQTKVSIYLACYYIVHQYAIPDNIRYLTLRCAVDGYKKFGLIKSNEEAMEALLKGLDHAVKKANAVNKKIHVDVILTAKRHKSIDEFSQNAALALKYRNGLPEALAETPTTFFETLPKVVSFDLAGLEKGNRAGKFYDQFLPLLKKCFPITIHAGEEDSYEAIWEAIYMVQSQRIGHALTLRNNRELLDIVKDRHIAVELCPLSNILTREKPWEVLEPMNRNNEDEYGKDNFYPLRQYLMENIDVTINTDNPFISGTTLTDEFMVAAKMAGGLTKWEVLRLIKNSFRSAALPKEQKKNVMDEIDDEIYSLLLDED